jgi:hypothetical protein
MSKSANANVDEFIPRKSHQLGDTKIHKIHASMEDQLYLAEKVTRTERRHIQVHRIRAQQTATVWANADWQRALEPLEGKIDQVTPAKLKPFGELFQHQEQQLFQEVGTKSTSPRSIFAEIFAQTVTAAVEEVYWLAHITIRKCVQFRVCLSNADIGATTCSITDMDRVVNQLG